MAEEEIKNTATQATEVATAPKSKAGKKVSGL